MRALRSSICSLLTAGALFGVAASPAVAAENAAGPRNLDTRSFAREIADFVAENGLAAESQVASQPGIHLSRKTGGQRGDRNLQVNDPALDRIYRVPGQRPFEESTQSETTIASFGKDIVVGYNSSADQPVEAVPPSGFRYLHRHLSGYSASHDGGKTWTSGFVPPVPGSKYTFGDPSVGVDRAGTFYYVSLGTDGANNDAVIVNKSTDRGRSFAPAVVAALDRGSDKEWLAVGPDPEDSDRDNLYIAWTSFQRGGSQLRFVKSTDGGASWAPQQTLFAPLDGGPTGMSSYIQFANPTVDASNGRLYIPFLHFSNFDADFIKVLVSNDAGATFRFSEFNVPGAPDKYGFPNVTPGTVADCGTTGGIREVLHQGEELGGGRRGLPRYQYATRLITQPSAVAAEGRLFISINSSTSPIGGDPNAQSFIQLLYSLDGAKTWGSPVTVAPATDEEPQHVHPAISADEDGEHIYVAYYTQQSDEQLHVDLMTGKVGSRGVRFEKTAARVSSVAFDLIPSNIPIPTTTEPFLTTNYDRPIRPCYDIGEYMGVNLTDNGLLAAWGDNRNPWTSPDDSPAAGAHAQADVFFERVSLK
jgi:hypothetical protein